MWCCCKRRDGWQPFSGGFRCGRVIRLCDWPRPLAAILLMQRHQAPANARPPSSPKSTMSSLNRGTPPTCLASVLLPPLPSPPLTALKIRNTSACPLWMSPWPAHFYLPTAIGWKARASHPSKPCRATSALNGHAYSAAGQAALALHSMAVLQVFQAKMLTSEEAGLDAASLRERASSSRSASAR